MRSVRYGLACLLPLVLGSALYAAFADPGLPIFQFEFAGSARRAAELTRGREGAFSDALNADYAFLAGYAGTIVAACALGLRRGGRRGALWFGIGAGVTAALFDVTENLLLARGLDGGGDGAFAGAAVAAGLKFALVIPAAAIAVWALTRRQTPRLRPDAASARG